MPQGRFTGVQQKISDWLKDLLSIYNKDGFDGSPESWEQVGIGQELEIFFRKFFENNWFLSEADNYSFLYTNINQLKVFKGIFDSLYRCIFYKEYYHFNLESYSAKVDAGTNFENLDLSSDSWKAVQKSYFRHIIKNPLKAHVSKLPDKVKYIMPLQETEFVITAASAFGHMVLQLADKPDLIDQNELPARRQQYSIKSYKDTRWDNLSQILGSILVGFQFQFGNFERINICQCCGNLYFIKKYEEGPRASRFCGDPCRRKAYVSPEPKEKYNCRRNQNEYGRRHIRSGQLHTILKSDCEGCDNQKPGGKCGILIERNDLS